MTTVGRASRSYAAYRVSHRSMDAQQVLFRPRNIGTWDVELLILGPLAARVDGRPITLGPPTQRLFRAALLLGPVAAAARAADRGGFGCGTAGVRPARGRGVRQPTAVGTRRRDDHRRRERQLAVAAPADAQRFEALAGSAPDEARLSEALAMWRGAVLEDLTYEGSLRTEISRLEELRLAVRERLPSRGRCRTITRGTP